MLLTDWSYLNIDILIINNFRFLILPEHLHDEVDDDSSKEHSFHHPKDASPLLKFAKIYNLIETTYKYNDK